MRSEMCSLHLTHPSTHTRSSGQPMQRRPGSSRGFGALLKGLTSVVDTSYRSRDSNPQPRVTSPTLYPLGHDCPCEYGDISRSFSMRYENRYLVPNIDILIHTISALNRSPCSQRLKICGNRCRTISSSWPKALLLWEISMNCILFSLKMGKHEELKDKQISSHCISFTPIYIFMEMKTKTLPRNIYEHGP